jgi:DNA-binding NtrC family response regulator
MPRRTRILLAEDDYDVRSALADALRKGGYDVIAVCDGASVKKIVDDCVFLDVPAARVDVLITDVRMPRLDGLGLLAYLEEIGFAVPAIVITAFGDRDIRATASACGASAVIDKPIDLDELERSLREALSRC